MMEKIKNIFNLYKLDWKRINKNKLSILLMVALMFVPSLYAWFNIKALWDPFGNTSQLPVAVYSDDKDIAFGDKKLNIGSEVMTNLEKNDSLDWKFVSSKASLEEGVKSGKYYAGIYLPHDFSSSLISFVDGDLKKPKIEYYVNTKINAIAPRITDKGATTIQDTIRDQFTEVSSSTLMNIFNRLGITLEDNLPTLRKLKSTVLRVQSNLSTIDSYTDEIKDLQAKMPEIKDKVKQAQAITAYIPEIDKMANKLVELDTKMPEIKQKASIILDVQKQIPDIKKLAAQIKMVDENMNKVEKTLNSGITTAKDALTVLSQVQKALPELKTMIKEGGKVVDKTQNIAKELNSSIDGIASSIKSSMASIKVVLNDVTNLANKLNQFLEDNKLSDSEKAQLQAMVDKSKGFVDKQIKSTDSLIKILKQVDAYKPSDKIKAAISKLETTKTQLTNLSNKLGKIDFNKLDVNEAVKVVNSITDACNNIESILNKINVDSLANEVKSILSSVIKTSEAADKLLAQANKIDFDSLVSNAKTTVSNAVEILETYQKEIPALKQEIHNASEMINNNLGTIISSINKAADFYNNKLPELEKKLDKVSSFIQNDWPSVKKDLTTTIDKVNEKLPMVEKALNKASDFIDQDWPKLKKGINKAADTIKKGEKDVDLKEIIKLLKSDVKKESDFFTHPIELKEHKIYPLENNGSASTPFYTALCLWVGALLFASVATTKFKLEGNDKLIYSDREQHIARWLTFVTVGFVQSLIVTLGNYFLLKVQVESFGYSILFGLLISLCFMTMVYTFVAIFGTFGKGIAIVILVLSVAGGGGNYPIQVSGPFFQFINPLLPFTYACNLLRESAGGIYWPNANMDIMVLIGFTVVTGILGTLIYPKVYQIRDYVENKFHESDLFH